MNQTCLIVHPVFSRHHEEKGKRDLADILEEIEGLARAIHLDVLESVTLKTGRIHPGRFFGKGHTESFASLVQEKEPDVVIVNHPLSPVQQRNLEKEWQTKIIDRTGLILEIFGERAQTKEGRIQVELAALDYQRSRLVRSWTHLERQRGGAGFMGGPGERQIELDRRLITEHLTQLRKELEGVRKTRDLGRKSRERVPFPVIALVGYTNAGKSTLFNRLTGAKVFAKDLLFATLDPTMRRIELPSGREVILADTVGFISDLPTHLVASFRATLEQVLYADIILHVRDVSRHDHEAQKHDVIAVLRDMGIDTENDERIFEAMNKIDLCETESRAEIERECRVNEKHIALSALTGLGEEALLSKLDQFLARHRQTCRFLLRAEDGQALSWLYEHGEILERENRNEKTGVLIHMEEKDKARFESRFGYKPEEIQHAN